MNQLISIIIVQYHHQQYLPFAVQSVKDQTYQKWELYIVNDDPEINLNGYISKDNRIKVVNSEKNIGQPAQINKILPRLKGEYIAFLDADDIWFPEHLKRQLEFMQNNKLDMSYGDCIIQKLNGLMYYQPGTDWNPEIIMKERTITTFSSIICKNWLLRRAPFDPDARFGQDRVWSIDVSRKTNKVACIHHPMFLYRDFTTIRGAKRYNLSPFTKFQTLLVRLKKRKLNKWLQNYIDNKYSCNEN